MAHEAPQPMTEAQRALVAAEDRARNLFADQPNHPDIQDTHLLLENVFQNEAQFLYQDETEDEKLVPKVLTQNRRLDVTGSAIVNKATFVKNWNEFTQGMNWTNVFAAGGAVLGCLAVSQEGYRGSDVDLFIHGILDEEQANQKLREIYDVIIRNTRGRGDVIRTHRAITILNPYPYRHIQVILRLYRTPAEVLLGFDIDSCCVGYDGTDVCFRRALTKRYNLVNISRRSLTYESRLFKYSKRGFAVAVPNLDKSRVNPSLFEKQPKELHGLGKLLLYDYIQKNGRTLPRRQRKALDEDEEGSDYNNDVHIPWGPAWQSETIINMLHSQNKAKFFSSIKKQPSGEAKDFEHLLMSDASKLAKGLDQWQRSIDKVDVQRKLTWIRDNPAYQDFDNGFKRLMTGSFEPVVDDNWDKGVYAQQGQRAADPSVFSANSSSYKDATTSGSLGTTVGNTKKSAAATTALQSFVPFGAKNKAIKSSRIVQTARISTGGKAPLKQLTSKSARKQPTPEGGVFTSATSPTDFGGPSISFGIGGFQFGSTPNTTSSSVPPSVSGFGGGAISWGSPVPPSAPTTTSPGGGFGVPPANEVGTGYTLSNYGGYAGQTQSNFVDTPSKGLSAFGPQPGQGLQPPSFVLPPTFTNAPPTLTPSVPSYTNAPPTASQTAPQLSAPSLQPRAPGTVLSAAPTESRTVTSPTAKLLLLFALFAKRGQLSADERSALKDRVLRSDPIVLAALEVFEIDQDLDELLDTLKRLTML